MKDIGDGRRTIDKDTILEWVDVRIREIDDDERHHYERANVVINAPLALVQLEMSSRMLTLRQLRKFLEDQ